MSPSAYRELAGYQNCIQRVRAAWPKFLETRQDRLRHGDESEKVAEAIVEDLLTTVLDWDKGDLTYQVESDVADVLLRLASAARAAGLLPPWPYIRHRCIYNCCMCWNKMI